MTWWARVQTSGRWLRLADAREAARCCIAGLTVALGRRPPQPAPGPLPGRSSGLLCPQPPDRGPAGRALCRWCHREVPKGRRSWCSPACIEAYRVLADWQHIRRIVFRRDGGICQLCGCDVARMARVASWANSFVDPDTGRRQRSLVWRYRGAGSEWLAGLGFNRCQDLWQADHVVPVVRGGTHHPDNLRLLCVPCHKAETAALAADRATERRDAAAALFADLPGATVPGAGVRS